MSDVWLGGVGGPRLPSLSQALCPPSLWLGGGWSQQGVNLGCLGTQLSTNLSLSFSVGKLAYFRNAQEGFLRPMGQMEGAAEVGYLSSTIFGVPFSCTSAPSRHLLQASEEGHY